MHRLTSRKSINLSDIRTFVVLVEEGSFTRAGEKLLCSRSHISKQLAQLEAALGVTLLVRTTRTQQLTPQGEAFFQQCKRSLNGISDAVDQVLDSAEALSGVIKINSVGGLIGEQIVAAMVNDFLAMHPDIRIELMFNSERVDPVSGDYDFVFRMGELADSSLIARKLTDLSIDTYASPQYLSRYGRPQQPSELAQHRCVVGSLHSWSFVREQQTCDVLVDSALLCKNGQVMLSTALAGNGIIRVPAIYCRREVEEGRLVKLFDDWQIEPTSLYLVYKQDKYQAARVRVFKDFVVDNFASYL